MDNSLKLPIGLSHQMVEPESFHKPLTVAITVPKINVIKADSTKLHHLKEKTHHFIQASSVMSDKGSVFIAEGPSISAGLISPLPNSSPPLQQMSSKINVLMIRKQINLLKEELISLNLDKDKTPANLIKLEITIEKMKGFEAELEKHTGDSAISDLLKDVKKDLGALNLQKRAIQKSTSKTNITLSPEMQSVKSLGMLTPANFPQHSQIVLNQFYKKPMPAPDNVTVPTASGQMIAWKDLSGGEKEKILEDNRKGQSGQTPLILPYEGPEYCKDIIPRWSHGSMHVTRASVEIDFLAELYRKHDPTFKISPEDILLAKYMTIFHDSARQAEGVDVWDDESVENSRPYLLTMGFPPEKVDALIKDLKNKDNPNYLTRSPISSLVHDADCLDILRIYKGDARDEFDNNFLDIFKFLKHDPKFVKDLESLKKDLGEFIDFTEQPLLKANLEKESTNYHGEVSGLVHFSEVGRRQEKLRFPFLSELLTTKERVRTSASSQVQWVAEPENFSSDQTFVVKTLPPQGQSERCVVSNENGQLSLWESVDPGSIPAETNASNIANFITGGLVPVSKKFEFKPSQDSDVLEGTLQPFVQLNTDVFDSGNEFESFDPAELSAKQREQLFIHMISDRLIGHMTEAREFGLDPQGNVIVLKKDQAFKFNPLLTDKPDPENFSNYLLENPQEARRIWNSSNFQQTLKRCRSIRKEQVKEMVKDISLTAFAENEAGFVSNIYQKTKTIEAEFETIFQIKKPLTTYPNQEEIQTFIQSARTDLLALNPQELERGFATSLEQIAYLTDPEDKTTLLTVAEKIASFSIKEGGFKKAMKIRMQAAQGIGPAYPLAKMDVQFREHNPRLGSTLQPVDTSIFKNHTLTLQKQTFIDGHKHLHVEGRLGHHVRTNLEKTLKFVTTEPKEFLAALPKDFCKNVTVSEEEAVYFGRQNKNNKRYEGDFSRNVEDGFKIETSTGTKSKVKVINFEGVGKVLIGSSPRFLSQHNRIQFHFEPGISEKMAGEKLNILMASLGLGAASSSTRKEDVERIKVLQLFRTFYPKESYEIEQQPEVFEESIEKLKARIQSKVPAMGDIFEHRLHEMYEQEVYPGQTVWAVGELAQEVMKEGGLGLMAGINGGSFEGAAESLVAMFDSGALSTEDRMRLGIIAKGASPGADIEQGGSGNVYSRLITKSMPKQIDNYILTGKLQLFIDPAVLERGGYCYLEDSCGTKKPEKYGERPNILTLAKQCETDPSDLRTNEVCIRSRISPEFFRGVRVDSAEDKEYLIALFKERGIIQKNGEGQECINGILVDNFFHTRDIDARAWNLPDGTRKITLKDGTILEGVIVNNKLKGQGTLTMPGGSVLKGEFTNGELTRGTIDLGKGRVLEGDFQANRLHGQGKIVQNNKIVSEGAFVKGKLNGIGKMINSNGTQMEGIFRDNSLNGTGKSIAPDGTQTEGVFRNNILNGPGRQIAPNGITFEGTFENGTIDGEGYVSYGGLKGRGEFEFGVLVDPVYLGFEDEARSGKGVVIHSDNRIDEGQFKNGRLDGQGKSKRNQALYEGIFKNGILNGVGQVNFKNGTVWKGSFEDEALSGEGEILIPTQSYSQGIFTEGSLTKGKLTNLETDLIQEGIFVNDLLEGTGTMTYSDKSIEKGVFIKGKLTGPGTKTTKNGDRYEGRYENGVLKGPGKLTLHNKFTVEGTFSNGSINGEARIIFSDGTTTSGTFKNNRLNTILYSGITKDNPNGFGRIVGIDESFKEGEFQAGLLEGQGRIVYSTGESWQGPFKQGQLSGEGGMKILPSGIKMEGLFKSNAFNQGKMTYPDGTIDEGIFLANLLNGLGKKSLTDGTISEGTFKMGKLVNGTKTLQDGVAWVGQFDLRTGKLNGAGKILSADGQIIAEGIFKNGELEMSK